MCEERKASCTTTTTSKTKKTKASSLPPLLIRHGPVRISHPRRHVSPTSDTHAGTSPSSRTPHHAHSRPLQGQNYPTDYAQFVLDVLAKMTRHAGAIDQAVLRRAIGLASSYLVTDVSTNPDGGIATWQTGFNRLVDLVVVLHHRGELELDTVNEASKACSECWSVAATWRGMEECRQGVKEVAGKLKKLLDEPNRRTYKGHKVYTP